MRIIPEFPEHRRQDPMRQTELCVYNQVEASKANGVALYECHPTPSSPEVDFVIILTGVAHYAVQVKGGRWRMEDGRFQLHTDEGWVNTKPRPRPRPLTPLTTCATRSWPELAGTSS